MIINKTNDLDLERIPLSLRFTQSTFRRELIRQKQRGLIEATKNHTQYKNLTTRKLLLEAIKEADRALWK